MTTLATPAHLTPAALAQFLPSDPAQPRTSRAMLVYRKGQPINFTSDLTDMDAKIICSELQSSFARDLASRQLSSLSPSQIAWMHKLAMDSKAPTVAPLDGSKVLELFRSAIAHLKYPKISMPNFALTRCGERSRTPGAIRVVSPNGVVYFGTIGTDGKFTPNPAASSIIAELTAFLLDPVGESARHGQLSGKCCFCRRHLDDERSTAVGYGPVCARHFGLPWGQ